MKIRDFIRDQFRKRLEAAGCLVIYDGERRYGDCASDLASDTCAFINAGDSIITGREQALNEWLKLARPGKSTKQQKQLVVYVPAPKPETDEDRCRDPFQIFALGGGLFPEGDGDSYQALCRRAKPDFAVQIEALFQAGVPDFDTVDNVGADTLRAMTMCCLPSINTMQVDGQVQVKVTCDPLDLIKLIKRDFMLMNLMCERAEISEVGIYDRTKAVFEYFNLPFNAKPPAPVGYVAPQSVRGTARIGRNDPCPCGSGKKYKKCCGKG